jgi:hypothetical protein
VVIDIGNLDEPGFSYQGCRVLGALSGLEFAMERWQP